VVVHVSVIETFEISSESKALHPPKKGWVMGKHILKWAVFRARFTHQNPPGFLHDLSFSHSGPVSEVGDTGSPLNHRVSRLNVATRAQ
jgi:hypothetical protein